MSELSLNSFSNACCTLTISHIPKGLTEADMLNEIKAVAGESSFILYMPQEKQSRHSGRAFVCFSNPMDTMSCFKALNRKRLVGSKGKRCEVNLGLVHRKQALPAVDTKQKQISGTLRNLFSHTAKRSAKSPVSVCMGTVDNISDSCKGSVASLDSFDLLAEDASDDDDELDSIDPDVLSRFTSRFGHKCSGSAQLSEGMQLLGADLVVV